MSDTQITKVITEEVKKSTAPFFDVVKQVKNDAKAANQNVQNQLAKQNQHLKESREEMKVTNHNMMKLIEQISNRQMDKEIDKVIDATEGEVTEAETEESIATTIKNIPIVTPTPFTKKSTNISPPSSSSSVKSARKRPHSPTAVAYQPPHTEVKKEDEHRMKKHHPIDTDDEFEREYKK